MLFSTFLELLASAAKGTAFTGDCSKVLQTESYARQHQVWMLWFCAVKQLYEQGKIEMDAATFQTYKQGFLMLASKQMQRSSLVHEMYQDVIRHRYSCCLLKGEAVADLYAQPLSRPSSDVDFLIEASKEKEVCHVAQDHGFVMLDRPERSHHAMCKHPTAGLVEFHLSLYDDLFEDVWFDDQIALQESYRTIRTSEGYEYRTLGVTDGLIFLFLHFTKHFLCEGVGVRQLLDFLLYLSHHREAIDFERFYALCKHLKYERFFAACQWIGVEKMGFSEEELCFRKEDVPARDAMEEILREMEQGGVFGNEEDWAKRFFLAYTQARFSRFKEGEYGEYIHRFQKKNVVRALFPNRIALRGEYPVLERFPWVLPGVWVIRLWRYLADVLRGNKNPSHVLSEKKESSPQEDAATRERLELLQRLDMI